MKKINLAFKAFDVHELLCHFIAEYAGFYANAGICVTLIDCTFISDDALPDNTFHAACGASLANFLKGADRKIVFVACDKPMFWLYGHAEFESVAQLDAARVATFPDVSPPAYFLKSLFSDAGLKPQLLPCRDDTARLGLLTSGNADAALISSAYLPHELEARGLKKLAFIGDHQRLPSSGLAVTGDLCKQQPGLVATTVGVYQRAMHLVCTDEALLQSVLVDVFNMPASGIDEAVQTIRSCYNEAGSIDKKLLQAAVDTIALGMGIDSRLATDLYDFSHILVVSGCSKMTKIDNFC